MACNNEGVGEILNDKGKDSIFLCLFSLWDYCIADESHPCLEFSINEYFIDFQ